MRVILPVAGIQNEWEYVIYDCMDHYGKISVGVEGCLLFAPIYREYRIILTLKLVIPGV